jgi:protein O-mannosyl-transferase
VAFPIRLTVLSLLLATYVVVALGLYYPGLDGPMYYDSQTQIQGKEDVFSRGDLRGIIAIAPQRPLPLLSFYGNYSLSGMWPPGFRLVNIVLLALSAILVVCNVVLVFMAAGHSDRVKDSRVLILFCLAGLWYLVHPVHCYATLYIWQRMALMANVFYLATMAVYLAVRLRMLSGPSVGYPLALLLFSCALLSKENTAVLPVILILLEAAFFSCSHKDLALRAVVLVLLPFLLLWVLPFRVHPGENPELGSGPLVTAITHYRWTGLTLLEVILTQCRNLFSYASIVLFPMPGTIQLVTPTVISQSLFDPASTVAAVIGVLMLALCCCLLFPRRPLSALGILFFGINLIPESLFVPQYLFYSYRASLPLFGFVLLIGDGVLAIHSWTERTGKAQYLIASAVFLIAVSAGCALVTWEKAVQWSDDLAVWTDVVEHFPTHEGRIERSTRVHAFNNLAAVLVRRGFNQDAAAFLTQALELEPASSVAHTNLGQALLELGRHDDAVKHLKKAVELDGSSWQAYNSLGIAAAKANHPEEAVRHFEKALSLAPGHKGVQQNLDMAGRLLDTARSR